MKKIIKSGLMFWVFVGLYLFVREWPNGSTWQTVLDVLATIAIFLALVDMFMGKESS
ncbi:hypothetical protein [Desulfuribacillus stibiiarsenatis]|uniref:hypothetical protein n=1 Tax=Desulfuribacillus stibiiarsenatis TaxID=1390249 RepID=UPI00159F342D|nr:hypothetical protein [Desulfuribacillus stibiiarsenatis]